MYLLLTYFPCCYVEVAVSALTHITRIRRDFDVANSLRYRDNNTLPHVAHFHGENQETLCKSREAVTVFLQNQRGDCFFITICNYSILYIQGHFTVVFVDIMHEHKTNFDSSERQYIAKVETVFTSHCMFLLEKTPLFIEKQHENQIFIYHINTLFHHWCSPLILRASCMCLGIIVTLLACIAHKFVSSKRLTKYASDASCRHTTASMVNLMPKFISLAISHTKL